MYQLGYAWDDDGTWFFEAAFSMGLDTSVGISVANYYPVGNKGFDVTDLEGIGSSYNLSTGPFGRSKGGNLPEPSPDVNIFTDNGLSYKDYAFSTAFGLRGGFTFQRSETVIFGTHSGNWFR
ncbi:MAG: hypothetical protein AAFX87_06595 [Bacteroidota bacterium]